MVDGQRNGGGSEHAVGCNGGGCKYREATKATKVAANVEFAPVIKEEGENAEYEQQRLHACCSVSNRVRVMNNKPSEDEGVPRRVTNCIQLHRSR